MENKIPTAEEYWATWSGGIYTPEEIMKEFAKFHVQAALKAAVDNACNQDGEKYGEDLSAQSILSAYPLDQIK